MYKLSVITICFNNLDDVKATCASIDSQTTSPHEHLIVNGSFEPDVANWLENSPQPPYRRWIHIRNEGIAGNFTRGIENTEADIVHLLNSGDYYASNHVIAPIMDFFNTHPAIQWTSGKLKTIRAGHLVDIGKPFKKQCLYKGMRSVSHPTWFVRRAVYQRHGLYNKEYKIAMDYDMMCRIVDEPYAFLDIVTTYFDNTGISSVKYISSLKENIKVYESYFGFSLKCRLWQFRLRLYHYFFATRLGSFIYGLIKGEK